MKKNHNWWYEIILSAECHSHIIKTEFWKIVNLLNATSVEKDLSTFVNKKWIEVYDPSEENYRLNRADLCDFSVRYIVGNGVITITDPDGEKRNKSIAFKDKLPFISCILKIYGVLIDNAEDLDVVMPIYNVLECSKIKEKQQIVWVIIAEITWKSSFFEFWIFQKC